MKLAAFLAASVSADVLETEETFNKEFVDELTDGDIRGNFGPFFQKNSRSAIRSDFVRWPSSTNYVRIPFEMASHMPIVARGIAQDAQRNYALRTCIDLQPWQGEEDYIYITQSGGCWSYIGWAYNGGQQLSIGERCTTQSGTFQHEFMHALGIFHEQSRPDRDTYVEINEENIQDGTLNNFNKYDFDYVDIKDVPYDYESVMHYGARGFAINNTIDTIITKIPYFSKVIGQRKDFSRGDVKKINNMYECSIPLRNSYSVDFTEMNWGGFVNEPVDNPDFEEKENRIDWRQYDVREKALVGDTSYHGTNGQNAPKTRQLVFPDSDQSDGRFDHGRYLALNGSWFEGDDHTGKTGILQSKQFTTTTKQQCLEIWTNIKSAQPTELKVEIWESDDRFGEVVGRFPVQRFTITAEEQQRWESNRWTIDAPERFKVLITSTLTSDEDVIVVDDISVLDKVCESHSWPIYGFQELYDSKEKGEYITSEMMTAPTGHKFKLRFYPKGHPDSDGTYASLFFHLHEESNNIPGLKWPMVDQYLKFIVQDQISDVVNRMDQNRIRSTEILENDPESPEGIWGMVDDADHEGLSEKSSVGYQTMIPLFDLFEASYSYIKHDMVMLMLDMRDLSTLDTSSKLDRCMQQCPDEWFDQGVSCLPDKEKAGEYSCQCRKPFIETIVDWKISCTCPEGYEYNPNAINEEVERLTCFSLCDFPETNPCNEDQICEQTPSGAVCRSENDALSPRSATVEDIDDSWNEVEEEDFIFGYTPLEFGLAVALGVVSAMLLMVTLFAFWRHEKREDPRSCEANSNPAFKPL